MQIRTFTADNAKAAIAKVRAELGPYAVIIAMDETAKGGGVIVRAALEPSAELALERAALNAGEDVAPSMLEDRLNQLLTARLRTPRASVDTTALTQALAFHRVPERIATALSNAAAASRATSAEAALADALSRRIDTTSLPEIPDRPLLLIGAPGAGKTSVAARLALRAVAAGARPLVITLDGEKAGARAQLETYADRLKFEAQIAADAATARTIAGKHKHGPIFIDSVGISVFDAADLAGTRDAIARLAAEAIAVMPAGLDAEEASDAAGIFAAIGVKRFICTRMDAARRLGGLLAAAAAGLGVAQFTSSPLIGRSLDTPDAHALAALLLSTDPAFASARAA